MRFTNPFGAQRRVLTLLVILGLVLICALIAALVWISKASAPVTGGSQTPPPLTDFIDCSAPGFARITPDQMIQFPADHGAHPDYCSEYWSFSGVLDAENQQRFGFQLTIFRISLAPEPIESESAWATNQVYRGQLSLADVQDQRFHATERYSRAALELAGAKTNPLQVWIETWSFTHADHFEISADQLKLTFTSQKSPVINALDSPTFNSYVLPRLTAQGTLERNGKPLSVSGQAWIEHAWGNVGLGGGQLALNRFFLQLDDQRELLLIQQRRRDGSGPAITRGVLIGASGKTYRLRRRDILLKPESTWRSPIDRSAYPNRWILNIADHDLNLNLIPLLDNQELNLSLRYWSGVVEVTGTGVSGFGYVDLTGYAQRAL